MEPDHETPMPRTRLPAYGDPLPGAGPVAARRAGVRSVRWMYNWTAAALIAGTAATAGYFAHAAHATPAGSVTGATAGSSPAAARAHQPLVPAPVVTSGGSGVVVRTTPGGAGGKHITVITYRDN
jgi:hypothetical protein